MAPSGFLWSWTRLRQALACSRAFHLSTSGVVPSQGAKLDVDTQRGIKLHQIAKSLVDPRGTFSLDLSSVDATEAACISNLVSVISKTVPALKRQLGSGTVINSELTIRLDRKLCPAYGWPNGFIVGSIDLALYHDPSKSAILVDYKSGPAASADAIADYAPQLRLYGLLYHRGHRPIERLGTCLVSLNSGELHWTTQGVEPFVEKTEIAWLHALLREAYANIDVSKPQESALCKYCDHRRTCLVKRPHDPVDQGS